MQLAWYKVSYILLIYENKNTFANCDCYIMHYRCNISTHMKSFVTISRKQFRVMVFEIRLVYYRHKLYSNLLSFYIYIIPIFIEDFVGRGLFLFREAIATTLNWKCHHACVEISISFEFTYQWRREHAMHANWDFILVHSCWCNYYTLLQSGAYRTHAYV